MFNGEIFIDHSRHPEDNAMVQALYSRSPKSVVEHWKKVDEVGSGKFMEQYYVGYDHKSIGDCGSSTAYMEGYSILAAKAIQSSPLYNGQEASTRYLDFSVQKQIDPYQSEASHHIQKNWIDLYTRYMPLVQGSLEKMHPFTPKEYKSDKMWKKAIDARAFDLLRCLLPAGTATMLSWHTNLRQARDHLRYLKTHPLAEVRHVANQIFDQLYANYKNSFNGEEMKPDSARYHDRDAYAAAFAEDEHYLTPQKGLKHLSTEEVTDLCQGKMIVHDKLMDKVEANRILEQIKMPRPKGGSLPRELLSTGSYNYYFLLDFGSFRDLHRHRNGYCPNPLIGNYFGFHRWYLDELAKVLSSAQYHDLSSSIDHQLKRIVSLKAPHRTPIDDQYLYPMGMSCLVQLTYSLPQSVYVAELRSGSTVHGSLREIAQNMGRAIEERHPNLALYMDYAPDSWSIKRGGQDITERKKEAAG